MKKLILLVAALSVAAAASASEQLYLLGTDSAPAQAAPTIVSVKDGNGERLVATFQRVDGTWVKHTLTKTNETQFGPFGERVVRMEDVIPNP